MIECGQPNPKCVRCGKLLEDKWINIWDEIGELCVYCAQHTMRILLEDLIQYHNGKHVSLLNIMYHGDEEEMAGVLKANKKLGEHLAALELNELLEQHLRQQAERGRKTNLLFEFDNENEESEK